MAQGAITAKIISIQMDFLGNTAFAVVQRYQEDSDGSVNPIGQAVDVVLQVPDWTVYLKAPLRQDIIAAARAQNGKLPQTIS